jgi:hypothetical protein
MQCNARKSQSDEMQGAVDPQAQEARNWQPGAGACSTSGKRLEDGAAEEAGMGKEGSDGVDGEWRLGGRGACSTLHSARPAPET